MERNQRVPRRPGGRSPLGRADPGRGHNSILVGIVTVDRSEAPSRVRPALRAGIETPWRACGALRRVGAPVSDRHRAGARNPHRRRRAPPISRLGAPVSDRHRAGARNLHRRRWPCQSHGQERQPPAGIARERETSADDTAPCQRECRTPSQHRIPRSLTAPLPAAVPLLTAPAKTPANKLRLARPSDGKGNRAATSP